MRVTVGTNEWIVVKRHEKPNKSLKYLLRENSERSEKKIKISFIVLTCSIIIYKLINDKVHNLSVNKRNNVGLFSC